MGSYENADNAFPPVPGLTPPPVPAPGPTPNWFKRHPVATVLLGLFALGVLIQAFDSEGSPTTAAPVTYTQTQTQTISPDPIDNSDGGWSGGGNSKADEVVAFLESKGIYDLSGNSDYRIDQAGQATCRVAKSLYPMDNYDAMIMASAVAEGLGVSTTKGAKVAGAFIGAYCPQWAP